MATQFNQPIGFQCSTCFWQQRQPPERLAEAFLPSTETCVNCLVSFEGGYSPLRHMAGEDSDFVIDQVIDQVPYCFSSSLKDRPRAFQTRTQSMRSVCKTCFQQWCDQKIVQRDDRLLQLVQEIVSGKARCHICHKQAQFSQNDEKTYARILREIESGQREILSSADDERNRDCYRITNSQIQIQLGPLWALYDTSDKVLHRYGSLRLLDFGSAKAWLHKTLEETLSSLSLDEQSIILQYSVIDLTLLNDMDGQMEHHLYSTLWCSDCADKQPSRILFPVQCGICQMETELWSEFCAGSGISCTFFHDSETFHAGYGSVYDESQFKIVALPSDVRKILSNDDSVNVCDACIARMLQEKCIILVKE